MSSDLLEVAALGVFAFPALGGNSGRNNPILHTSEKRSRDQGSLNKIDYLAPRFNAVVNAELPSPEGHEK